MLILVFYVPETHKESVKEAVFAAGAGRYRNYDRCAWETAGTGQFRPLDGANPFLGTSGTLERVVEFRVEMLCPEEHKQAVIAALKLAHPYEEPAWHLIFAQS